MLDKLIELAFEEDLLDVGDVTSDAIFSNELDTYFLVAKQDGILCGAEIFEMAFKYLDQECEIVFYFKDGDFLTKGDKVACVSGKIRTLLKAERTALNFISHLSGIATETNRYVRKVAGKTRILDTRKTLPGWRELQKYAVKCGGGSNHRMGLYDMVMIKDNHIDGAGGISNAVARVREKWGERFKIEVETRNFAEIEEALDAGADIIMLDNMDNETMKKAVELIDGRSQTEASGNMTLERITGVAETGVDFISIGSLTHSVKVFDFSLKKLEG